MTTNEHLLACVAEECSEVTKECMKALRFGLEDAPYVPRESNAIRIMKEVIELGAVVIMLQERNLLPIFNDVEFEALVRQKKDRVLEYLEYARQRGTVSGV